MHIAKLLSSHLFFSCTLRYETTSCRGNKMEWNKLENRVTPVLFYSVVNCTLITILVCHDAFPLYIFENEWIWTSFPVRVCLCVVFLSICPSICDVLDVCFISFIVIFNSKTNVLQLTSCHMRKLQRTEITDGMSLPTRIINSTLIKWIGVENNQVVPYLDECILMRCWSHIAQPTTGRWWWWCWWNVIKN